MEKEKAAATTTSSQSRFFNAHLVAASELYDAQRHLKASQQLVAELTSKLKEAKRLLNASQNDVDAKRREDSEAYNAFHARIRQDII